MLSQAFHAAVIEIILQRPEPRQQRRRRNTAHPHHRKTVRVQSRLASRMRHHAIVIVLHVVFARPRHFDRPSDGLGNLHRFADKIGFKPPPKSAAQKCRVDEHGARVEPRNVSPPWLANWFALAWAPTRRSDRREHARCSSSAPSWHAPETELRSSLQTSSPRLPVPLRRRPLFAPPDRAARRHRQVAC